MRCMYSWLLLPTCDSWMSLLIMAHRTVHLGGLLRGPPLASIQVAGKNHENWNLFQNVPTKVTLRNQIQPFIFGSMNGRATCAMRGVTNMGQSLHVM